jgi:hypothetical protein
MRCLACGAEMRLERVAADDSMPVPGFEHHTFICSACGDIERRRVFNRHGERTHADPVALHTAPPISPSATIEHEGAAAPAFVKRVFAKLYRVSNAVGRRNASRSTVSDSTKPQISAPAVEPVSKSIAPAVPHLTERATVPTVPPVSTTLRTDKDFDECETLLRGAIEMLQSQPRCSQIATSLPALRSATAATTSVPMPVERRSEPVERKSPVVAVQIHHDPNRAKYVAKDTKSGLTVLRHQDSTWLKAMCDRMGWQVIDAVTSEVSVAQLGK